MILPTIHELTVVGVADAGVPNRERIVLRPTQAVDLAEFGLFIGIKTTLDMVTPAPDLFFWFGELTVHPPAWIVIYTGSGQYQQSIVPGTTDTAHTYHWGRPHTLFHTPEVVPVLFRLGGIEIGDSPWPR